MNNEPEYTYRLDRERLIHGCSMTRAFPYVIRNNRSGVIVMYAKTEDGAQRWIQSQLSPKSQRSTAR